MPGRLTPADLMRLRWILLLLLEGGGRRRYNEPVVGRTRLVKLLFLLREAFKVQDVPYEFVPYYYGPFSAEIYSDLLALGEAGLVQWWEAVGGDAFALTPEGVARATELQSALDPAVLGKIKTCKARYNTMPLDELLETIYDRFPRYAERSLVSRKNLLKNLREEFAARGIDERVVREAIREYRALREAG